MDFQCSEWRGWGAGGKRRASKWPVEKGSKIVARPVSSGAFDSAVHDEAVSGFAQDDIKNRERRKPQVLRLHLP